MKKDTKSKQAKRATIAGRDKQPKSRLTEITPKKVVGEAQRIVRLATDILEEEIAAGIVAAKEIEKKVIEVDKVRSQDKGHVISRFRTDAHEVIDILMDVVSVASTQLDNISNRIVSITPAETAASSPSNNIPTISNEGFLSPGASQEVKMQLQNDSKENKMNISLAEMDLVAPNGQRILARNLVIKPKTLVLEPGEKKHVVIKVDAPKSTKPGKYSGLLQDKKIENLKAMLSVDVSKND